MNIHTLYGDGVEACQRLEVSFDYPAAYLGGDAEANE